MLVTDNTGSGLIALGVFEPVNMKIEDVIAH
jgi:hypothetical protein